MHDHNIRDHNKLSINSRRFYKLAPSCSCPWVDNILCETLPAKLAFSLSTTFLLHPCAKQTEGIGQSSHALCMVDVLFHQISFWPISDVHVPGPWTQPGASLANLIFTQWWPETAGCFKVANGCSTTNLYSMQNAMQRASITFFPALWWLEAATRWCPSSNKHTSGSACTRSHDPTAEMIAVPWPKMIDARKKI
jgi:hypothetical protein